MSYPEWAIKCGYPTLPPESLKGHLNEAFPFFNSGLGTTDF